MPNKLNKRSEVRFPDELKKKIWDMARRDQRNYSREIEYLLLYAIQEYEKLPLNKRDFLLKGGI